MMQKKLNIISIISIFLFIALPMVYADNLLPTVRQTSLGIVPEGYHIIPNSIKISADWTKIAYAAYSDPTHNIIQTDNQTSPVYYAVSPFSPIWGPLNKRYGYIAFKNKAEAVVVVDDKTFNNIDNADNLIFSPHGKRYACRAIKDDHQFVIIDGQPQALYNGILIKDNFTFSPDDSRFIYVAIKNNTCVAVVDGQEQSKAYSFIDSVRFSPDSTHYAYKARTEKKLNGQEKWCVVKDGQAGKSYDHIFDLIFSPDSKHLAYTVIKDKKMTIVFDGHEMELYDRVGVPVFSFDSKKFAYGYMQSDNWYIVSNDQKSDPFDKIFKFYFSPDSKKEAFVANKDNKWFCVIDGKKEPNYKAVDSFKFSLDSSHYVYAGADGTISRIITDGHPGQGYLSVGEPYFSLDAKHLVYRAFHPGGEEWFTVLDGKELTKGYYGVGRYLFSPDSKHLAFPAAVEIDKSVMVVDGVEQCRNHNFKILGDPYFSPDGNYIVYHARSGKEKWHLIINGYVLPEIYGGFYKGTPIVFDSLTRFHTIGIKPGGKGFVLIEVDVPESFKLTSGINSL